MVRIASASSFLLMAASSSFTLSNANLEYQVRVRNLTYQQPFSRMGVVAHTEDIRAFRVGEPAPDMSEAFFTSGDLSEFLESAGAADTAPFVCGFTSTSDFLFPGEEQLVTLLVREDICPDDVLFSMVGMLGNTNDAFVGIDSAVLKTSAASTIYPPAYDAGIEENNELCSHIPGPACSDTSGNEEAGPGEGYVHVHRGFHGVGGELAAADYAWLNPVAEVFIDTPTSV